MKANKIDAVALMMHPAQLALVLLPLFTGCAAIAPAAPMTPVPAVVAPQPPEPTQQPQPPEPPQAPLPSTGTPAVSMPLPSSTVTSPSAAPAAAATERKPAARAAQAPAVATAPPRLAAAVPAPAAPPTLDLNGLKEQLKETKAIGVFTKLSLKNQVDDLLQQFRDHYQGGAKNTMAQLRRSFDVLLMKVLSLVQDADQRLASAIVASREAIWGLLSDQQKFSTLKV